MSRLHPFTERLLGALALSAVSGLGCGDSGATPSALEGAAGSGGGSEPGAGTGGLGGAAGSSGGAHSGGSAGWQCVCGSATACFPPEAVPVRNGSAPAGECAPGSEVDSLRICPPSDVPAVVHDSVRRGMECCYFVQAGCIGRPLVVDGELRRSDVARRIDWASPLPLDASLDPETSARLAEAWLDDALLEHASVAAFARFVLDLVALGAPPDLVRDASAAALDEVEHAKLCFSLAGRYAKGSLGPSTLDLRGSVGLASLTELAVSTFHEGCIGETLGALLASEQLSRARDPHVQAALSKIANDEARHAELAWRTLQWALRRGGAPVHAALASALSGLLDVEDRLVAAPDDGAAGDAWHAHGRLSRAELESVRRRGLREVVVPCVRALLASA